jgi:hypothetical protein
MTATRRLGLAIDVVGYSRPMEEDEGGTAQEHGQPAWCLDH